MLDTACVMRHQPDFPTATTDEFISIGQLPKLVWASVALFSINLVIGIGIMLTPNVKLDLYGYEVQSVRAASSKPSPFTEVIDTRKKKVQVAAKVYPVVTEAPETYELDLPLRTQPVVYTLERDKKFVVIN